MQPEPIPIESFWCRQHHLVSEQIERAEALLAELRRQQVGVALILSNIREAKGESDES